MIFSDRILITLAWFSICGVRFVWFLNKKMSWQLLNYINYMADT